MDKYDKAVAYLTEHPDEIYKAWVDPDNHEAGSLFLQAGPKHEPFNSQFGKTWCGCLTQVHAGKMNAAFPELTEKIRNDPTIPNDGNDITVAHLPIFAQWQRDIDAMFATESSNA